MGTSYTLKQSAKRNKERAASRVTYCALTLPLHRAVFMALLDASRTWGARWKGN